ncbi:MAG: hypothetical protein FJZ87_08810 [Chloroflexi bacterium]|nr:hypothetical protein [Chloroflexota bacterium]MBM3152385.1 hypothetical protein [Chloroflexota bacterium]
MNHLTDSQRNEYLDNALAPPARAAADAHLSACDSCRRALADLESLTSSLAALPDEPLTRNLVPSVLAALPRPRLALGWKLALAAQAGTGIGVILSVLADWQVRFEPQEWLAQAVTTLAAIKIPSLPASLFTVHHSPFTIHSSAIQASTANLVFFALSALLLWGVGNAVLLRRRNGASS